MDESHEFKEDINLGCLITRFIKLWRIQDKVNFMDVKSIATSKEIDVENDLFRSLNCNILGDRHVIGSNNFEMLNLLSKNENLD